MSHPNPTYDPTDQPNTDSVEDEDTLQLSLRDGRDFDYAERERWNDYAEAASYNGYDR